MSSQLYNLVENNEDFTQKVKFKRVKYKVNRNVLTKGKAHHEVFIIVEGSVRVITTDIKAEEREIDPAVREIKEGDYFGEFCLFSEILTTADVITNSECEFIVIEKQSLLTYFDEHPELGYEITREMLVSVIQKLLVSNDVTNRMLAWGLKSTL